MPRVRGRFWVQAMQVLSRGWTCITGNSCCHMSQKRLVRPAPDRGRQLEMTLWLMWRRGCVPGLQSSGLSAAKALATLGQPQPLTEPLSIPWPTTPFTLTHRRLFRKKPTRCVGHVYSSPSSSSVLLVPSLSNSCNSLPRPYIMLLDQSFCQNGHVATRPRGS